MKSHLSTRLHRMEAESGLHAAPPRPGFIWCPGSNDADLATAQRQADEQGLRLFIIELVPGRKEKLNAIA